ncbi:unnamed protein product, partial [Didymodactylos carnosus]
RVSSNSIFCGITISKYFSILSGQQCKSAVNFRQIGQLKTNITGLAKVEKHRIDRSKAQLEQIFQ